VLSPTARRVGVRNCKPTVTVVGQGGTEYGVSGLSGEELEYLQFVWSGGKSVLVGSLAWLGVPSVGGRRKPWRFTLSGTNEKLQRTTKVALVSGALAVAWLDASFVSLGFVVLAKLFFLTVNPQTEHKILQFLSEILSLLFFLYFFVVLKSLLYVFHSVFYFPFISNKKSLFKYE
jgi:hypothetical protein